MKSVISFFGRFVALKRSGAFREIATYAFQTYGITVINVISAFILVRLFTKDVYASYGIIFSIVGVLNVFLNGGMARLISFQILKSPLTEEERQSLMGYFQWGYLGISVLFLLCLPVIYRMYGLSISAFTVAAFFVQQFYDILNLVYISEVRERILKKYIIVLSILDYSRAIFPVLGTIFLHSLFGYFVGLLFSVVVCVSAFFILPFWRSKVFFYLNLAIKPLRSIASCKNYFKLGYGIALESGAGALYLSVLILVASRILRGVDLADLKVGIGYIATLGLVGLPLARWITFHLPSRLEQSKNPFSLLMKTSAMSFVLGLGIVVLGIVCGSWLLPLAYGKQYSSAVSYIAPASLSLLFTNGLMAMSVFTRKYALSWRNAQISLLNIFVGFLVLISPIGPRTAFGYALFYGFWVLPASIAMIFMTYRKIQIATARTSMG